jgi:phosphate transport system substrate-binding protein
MLRKTRVFLSAVIMGTLMISTTACGEVSVETVAKTDPTSTTNTLSVADAEIEAPASEASTTLKGSLTLTGSTSMSDVATALSEAFMLKNPEVIVSVGGNGSGEGPTAVNDGTAQIGMLSRQLKDSEEPAKFDQYIIGYDGIAVIVNPASVVSDLTPEQVKDIFTGKITNWSELGGADAIIQCIGREAASGTRGAFEELIDIEDAAVYAEEQNSTGNVKQAVSGNPNAIGYVSLSAVDETVKALNLSGVSPSEATVKSGEYMLQRPFLMITKAQSTDSLTQAFLDFIYSDEGQTIILDDGIVPNPDK